MFKGNEKKYAMWGITAFCVVAASVLFFFFIFRLHSVGALVGKILKILSPIIYGLVIAYLLGPIESFWNRRLTVLFKERMKNDKRAERAFYFDCACDSDSNRVRTASSGSPKTGGEHSSDD